MLSGFYLFERTKKESDKQLVRDHKYVKVGSMNASVPLGKGKGTAVDIELTEGTSGSIVLFINNGNKLELKVRQTGNFLHYGQVGVF